MIADSFNTVGARIRVEVRSALWLFFLRLGSWLIAKGNSAYHQRDSRPPELVPQVSHSGSRRPGQEGCYAGLGRDHPMAHHKSELRMGLRILLLSVACLLACASTAGASGPWTPIGPDGGNVQSIVADIREAKTLYLATDRGLIFKSLDGGHTWEYKSAVYLLHPKLAIDHFDPDLLVAGGNSGISYSHDGGSSWLPLLFYRGQVTSIDFDLIAPGTFFAGLDRGLTVTHNWGATWSAGLQDAGTVLGVATDPSRPGVLYVASSKGLVKSQDGGKTGKVVAFEGQQVSAVAMNVEGSNSIFVATVGGIYKARSDLGPWRNVLSVDSGLNHFVSSGDALFCSSFGKLFRSDDAGDSWQGVPLPETHKGNWTGISTFLVVDRDLLIGGTEGVARVGAAGSALQNSEAGMSALEINAIARDLRDPSTIYAVETWGSLFKARIDSWKWELVGQIPSTNVYAVIPSSLSQSTILVAGYRGIYKSVDRGHTWRAMTVVPNVTPHALVRTSKGVLYTIADGRLYRSSDDGETWENSESPGPRFESIAVVSGSAPMIFASYECGPEGKCNRVYRSRDGGQSWESSSIGDARDRVSSLAIGGRRDQSIYASTSTGKVFRSTNDGLTWELAIGQNNDLANLIGSPTLAVGDDRMYLFSDTRIFETRNQGRTWVEAARIPVRATDVMPVSIHGRPMLLVGTEGGSISILPDP